MRYLGFVGAALFMWTGWSLPAGAYSASVDDDSGATYIIARPLEIASPSPPNTTGVSKREGIRLQALAEDRYRLRVNPPSSRRPKDSLQTKVEKDGVARTKQNLSIKGHDDDFRVNVGICGPAVSDGTVIGPTRCQPYEPTPPPVADPAEPQPVTDDQPVIVQPPQPSDVSWTAVRTQVADVLFAPHRAKVQPAGRTLVNLDTIVYTDPTKITTQTVSLLGFAVIVEATPMSYTWNFGDGTPALDTTSPGAPYPSKEITHKYLRRGSVNVLVTTHYAARFNVAGTGWQYVDGTVPITGPATPLLVREAVPVLVDPNR